MSLLQQIQLTGGDMGLSGSSYPTITLVNKFEPSAEHPAIKFSIDIEKMEGVTVPPLFTKRKMYLGGKYIESYVAEDLPANVLAVRKRWVVSDASGAVVKYMPYGTKERAVGNVKLHIQALVDIEGCSSYLCLSLKGKGKTLPWTNTKDSNYPIGTEVYLRELSKAASKALGVTVSPFCTFKTFLTTWLTDKGEPKIVSVGSGRDTASKTTSTQVLCYSSYGNVPVPGIVNDWQSYYVGDDKYREYSTWWESEGRDWIRQWDSDFIPQNASEPLVEEDDAPF